MTNDYLPSLAWFSLAAASAFGAALAAGAELGMFSLSRVRLRLRTHQHDPAAVQLAAWLEEPTYPLQGLLILQNLFSFAFSASVTGMLAEAGFSETGRAILSTLLITPIVLIFCDIMPKDLFNTHADRWMYRLVPAMRWAFRVVTVVPLLPIVRTLSRVSLRLLRRGRREGGGQVIGPRTEILELFQESAATGAVSATQQDMVQRALRMARATIGQVMIPWGRVVGVPAAIGRDGFRALVRHYNVSRLPVLGRSTTDVLGVIEVLDVLADKDFQLPRHLHPAMTLIAGQSVRSAITLMQRARQTLAVVVDPQGRAIGLVTMKDLIEELIGDVENW